MNYLSKKIVNSNDLKLLWWVDWNTFKKRLYYNLKTFKLTKLRKWLYVFTDQFDNLSYEDYWIIWNSIYIPSYISFETVLNYEWVNFQYYNSIHVASIYNKEIFIESLGLNIVFHRLPKWLLLNPIWIIFKKWYNISTKERAICDVLFNNPDYYLDNFDWINHENILQLAKIYEWYKKWFYQNIYNLIWKYE
jgi:hypothetical protein